MSAVKNTTMIAAARISVGNAAMARREYSGVIISENGFDDQSGVADFFDDGDFRSGTERFGSAGKRVGHREAALQEKLDLTAGFLVGGDGHIDGPPPADGI